MIKKQKVVSQVMTVANVARYCNVSEKVVQNWIDSNELFAYRLLASNRRMVPADRLVEFLRLNNVPVTKELEEAAKEPGDLRGKLA